MPSLAGLAYRGRSALARLGIELIARSRLYQGYWNYWRSPHLFSLAESKGLHILPVHYYSPIPTNAEIRRARQPNGMAGFSLNVAPGAELATKLLAEYLDEIVALLTGKNGFKASNSGFAPLDAAVLYAMIRRTKPRRIIEIGSGMSTIVMLTAIQDAATDTSLTCIEPYLPDYLNQRRAEINAVIESPLQDIPLAAFDELESGDILFIDSTHVVKFGSDVVYEFLEILPRLKSGVIVHVHDIFLPDDYPDEWLSNARFFWNEQYLLQAFLCMNPNFRTEIPVHAIKNEIFSQFTQIQRTFVEPGSFWIRRTNS